MKIIITEQQFKKISEGVTDKYHEKKYGFEPEFADFEKKYTQQQISDKPIAYITDVPIYKNPKSLKLFDADVRAIADKNGNLYVALHDGEFYHGMMAHAIGLTKDPQSIYKSLKNVMFLHRVGKTNSFGLSDSNVGVIWKYEPNYIEIMNKMKSINPAYKIHLRYYAFINENHNTEKTRWYHGSNKNFENFEEFKPAGPSALGFFVASDKSLAELFGDYLYEVDIKYNNPYVITMDKWDEIRGKHAKDTAYFANWKKLLMSRNYDSIFIKERSWTESSGITFYDGNIVVLFDENQLTIIDTL